MSDALSRNSPKLEDVEPLQANCLAHGHRHVVDVADNFPEECRYVLETLRDVYHHDAQAREQAMSPEQRLRSHFGARIECLLVCLRQVDRPFPTAAPSMLLMMMPGMLMVPTMVTTSMLGCLCRQRRCRRCRCWCS